METLSLFPHLQEPDPRGKAGPADVTGHMEIADTTNQAGSTSSTKSMWPKTNLHLERYPGVANDPHMKIAFELSKVLEEKARRARAIRIYNRERVSPLTLVGPDSAGPDSAGPDSAGLSPGGLRPKGRSDARYTAKSKTNHESDVIAHAICDHLLASLKQQNDQESGPLTQIAR